jgi:cob(I)alamin adenosyltransferase
MSDRPRILIFTGDGKGKTTAALGMALRASGHGLPVAIVQFIKADATVGEIAAAAANGRIEIVQCGLGFLPNPLTPDPSPARGEGRTLVDHRAAAQKGMEIARDVLAKRQAALLILDEICLAVDRGLVDERQVIELVEQVPSETCVVLTGRGATPALVAMADTVTEMLAIKHGLAEGRTAEKGVEW